MLFIKRLFNKTDKSNSKKDAQEQPDKNQKYVCNINFGLLKDSSVDISIELNNIHVNENNILDESAKIAAFLHILTTGGLSVNIANILVQQIGSNHQYSLFVDEIIKSWVIYQSEHDKQISLMDKQSDTPVIKPTEVFGQYYSK